MATTNQYTPTGQPSGQTQNLPIPGMTLITMFGDTTISNDTYINEYSAMTVPAIWRAVNFTTQSLAQFGLDVLQVSPNGDKTKINHPVGRLLTRNISDIANPFNTLQTWFHHRRIWGNGYMAIKRDKLGGKPLALFNLNPEITFPFIYDNVDNPNDKLNGTKWFYVQSKTPKAIPASDVLHIYGLGFDGLRGYPPIQLLRQSIEVGKYAERFSADYFKKGTLIKGTINFPGQLTDSQMEAVRNSCKNYNGITGDNAGQVMVIPFGGKLENGTIENQTSQLIETRRFSIIEISQIFDVPPHILFELTHGKWSTTQQLGEEVVKFTLQPDLIQAAQEFNSKLFSEKEQEQGIYVKYDTNSLTKADPQTYQASITALVNNGMMIPNEGCKLLDLPSLGPAGDKLRLPSGGAGVVAAIQTIADPTEDKDSVSDDLATPEAGGAVGDQQEPTGDGSLLPDNAEIDPQESPPEYQKIIEPILSDVCQRIEAKTAKAFQNRASKPLDATVLWSNVFAGEQEQYVSSSFAPLRQIALQFKRDIPIEKIASRYAMGIKKRATGGQQVLLADIAKELINE